MLDNRVRIDPKEQFVLLFELMPLELLLQGSQFGLQLAHLRVRLQTVALHFSQFGLQLAIGQLQVVDFFLQLLLVVEILLQLHVQLPYTILLATDDILQLLYHELRAFGVTLVVRGPAPFLLFPQQLPLQALQSMQKRLELAQLHRQLPDCRLAHRIDQFLDLLQSLHGPLALLHRFVWNRDRVGGCVLVCEDNQFIDEQFEQRRMLDALYFVAADDQGHPLAHCRQVALEVCCLGLLDGTPDILDSLLYQLVLHYLFIITLPASVSCPSLSLPFPQIFDVALKAGVC